MSTPSPSPIEEQPIEALDAIALEIDNARDLLNLALTCKSLHALVYFRHLRFRVISGRLGDWRLVKVWDLIARDKTLGRSVRVLDLHPLAYTDPRFIIPLDTNRVKRQELKLSKKDRAALVKRTPYEIIADVVEYFVPALANMTRLISFSWREDGPREMFAVGRTLDPLSMLRKLWEGVNGCSNLERLSIRSGPHVDNSFFKMVRMEHVTNFSWSAEGPFEIRTFQEFLNRGLPNLRNLEIQMMYSPFGSAAGWSGALDNCNWPNLRVLKLASQTGGNFESIVNFLVRHPQIEELMYYYASTGHGVETPQFLPNLRILRTDALFIEDFLPRISSAVIETLELDGQYWARGATALSMTASALKGHPSRSISYLSFDPLTAAGDYGGLVEELPNLKSVNGVSYEGDVASMVNELCAKTEINYGLDDNETGIFS